MPKYQHDNFGDVMNHIYAKGIITSVDSENDLADVTVEGYQDGSGTPLYYHCEPDSEERSNGAIYGAASAFSVDDEVIVMLEVNGAPVRIVGFVDGIRSCIWEPWGDTLCENHEWYFDDYWGFASPGEVCPDLTGNLHFTLASSILSFTWTYDGVPPAVGFSGVLSWWDSPTPYPTGITVCRLGITVVVTHPTDRIVFVVADTDFTVVSTDMSSESGVKEIDLSSLNGNIWQVYFNAYCTGLETVSFDLDYIDSK